MKNESSGQYIWKADLLNEPNSVVKISPHNDTKCDTPNLHQQNKTHFLQILNQKHTNT